MPLYILLYPLNILLSMLLLLLLLLWSRAAEEVMCGALNLTAGMMFSSCPLDLDSRYAL
jgi:hypothetical protein